MIRKISKPPALGPGDLVGIVAPAAAVDREHLERGVGALRSMGYRVKISEHVLDRCTVLAGTDRIRAGELQAFFRDPEVKAIFSARGGYGCGRLLPMIDFAAIARTPKIFMGFSDATFLLNAIVDRAHMTAFHGPMAAMDFARGLSPRAHEHMRRLLAGETGAFDLEAEDVIVPGTAEGEMIGGCLSVVAAMLATPWEPVFDGRILFLEDTGEKAYRVDRMLVQMRQAKVFERAAGVVFGAIQPSDGSNQERELIAHFVAEQTRDSRGPVIFGINAGHGTDNLVLPFGLRARIETAGRRLIFEEPAVAA